MNSFEELDRENQDEVRALILAGLAGHWGRIDEALNPDLDDLVATYAAGRTVLVRNADGILIGTGTVVPRSTDRAEILRMSVAPSARRTGVGRRIVDELVATATSWGATTVVLETTSTWNEVIAFYVDCGFEVTHVEEGDFGSDTWFQRRLTGPA